MGLPLWKPRDIEQEQRRRRNLSSEEYIKHQEEVDEEVWSVFHPQLVYTPRRSSRHAVNNNNINNNSRHISPVASSLTSRRARISRRHSMLTSSLLDRRRGSRVHQLPTTSNTTTNSNTNTSPPVRSELDRRLQQRIHEKEDLLEQLQVTVSLLDEFLTARTELGPNFMTLPAFITEDLPAVLQSAASLAAMAPTVLSSSTPIQQSPINEVNTLHDMVDRLLQIPPYSTRIQLVETNIISAHRRIREQLGLLGTNSIPSPITRPSSSLENRSTTLFNGSSS